MLIFSGQKRIIFV